MGELRWCLPVRIVVYFYSLSKPFYAVFTARYFEARAQVINPHIFWLILLFGICFELWASLIFLLGTRNLERFYLWPDLPKFEEAKAKCRMWMSANFFLLLFDACMLVEEWGIGDVAGNHNHYLHSWIIIAGTRLIIVCIVNLFMRELVKAVTSARDEAKNGFIYTPVWSSLIKSSGAKASMNLEDTEVFIRRSSSV